MRLRTRLTERLGIEHPIISAPMGLLAGGRLAAAVSNAGGLGLIGGGYGDADWLDREFVVAGNAQVGCGFITWSLEKKPALLDQVLAKQPAALMLSFGSPAPFAARIKQFGVSMICQVQSMVHAREAVDSGADVIVAQGSEAGGHSGSRSTFTLVSEVADFLAHVAPDIPDQLASALSSSFRLSEETYLATMVDTRSRIKTLSAKLVSGSRRRAKNAFVPFLDDVFQYYRQLYDSRKSQSRSAKIAQLYGIRLRADSHPVRVILEACCAQGKINIDPKTLSRWTSCIRYARRKNWSNFPSEVARHGGISGTARLLKTRKRYRRP